MHFKKFSAHPYLIISLLITGSNALAATPILGIQLGSKVVFKTSQKFFKIPLSFDSDLNLRVGQPDTSMYFSNGSRIHGRAYRKNFNKNSQCSFYMEYIRSYKMPVPAGTTWTLDRTPTITAIESKAPFVSSYQIQLAAHESVGYCNLRFNQLVQPNDLTWEMIQAVVGSNIGLK